MSRYFFSFLSLAVLLLASIRAAESGALAANESLYVRKECLFRPPSGWGLMDPAHLSPRIKVGFFNKTKTGFCPSINLAIEEVSVTQRDYIKAVKALHEADRNNRWRDLGKIKTEAGTARLTEIDTKTEFGNVRMLQMILVKDGAAYILTAAALRDEFASFYKEIQSSFHSLTISSDLTSLIKQQQRKMVLNEKKARFLSSWKKQAEKQGLDFETLFLDKEFQEMHWIPLQNYILNEFSDLGAYWQLLFLKDVQQTCLDSLGPSQTDS